MTLKQRDAKSLYLLGGKYEREGDTNYAKRMYEYIIDSFPSSDFSVKANDRLLVIEDSRKNSKTKNQATISSNPSTTYSSQENQEKCLRRCTEREYSCEASCAGLSRTAEGFSLSPYSECMNACGMASIACIDSCY